MVLSWIKFLNKQNKDISLNLKEVILKIKSNNIVWLDIKPLEWKNNHFRCRVWKIRVLYHYNDKEIIIDKIWFRWDVYKSY